MADLPIILIELVLVFGGTLAFGWWQFREIRRDREKAAAERARRERDAAPPPPESPAG